MMPGAEAYLNLLLFAFVVGMIVYVTVRRPGSAAYPPIAAVRGGRRQRQSRANCGLPHCKRPVAQ